MKTTSSRAGRYVQQPTGYRAFIPNPLPPDPAVEISPEMQSLLSQADHALGRLDGSIQTLPLVSVNEVQTLIGTTYAAANDLVAKFVASGILNEITGQARNRKFMYQSYINLFREETGGGEAP